jgi:hypothetical protein
MSTPHQRLWAITSMAALFALSGCTSLPPACPVSADVQPEQLHGIWKVQLDGTGTDWSLQLEPHPEHRGSLRGELKQGAQRYPVVADLEKGEFTLEESHDGQRIAATWLGEVVPGSCGRALQGQRIGPQERRQAFDMQR